MKEMSGVKFTTINSYTYINIFRKLIKQYLQISTNVLYAYP